MPLAFGKLVAHSKQARRIKRAFGMNVADKTGCSLRVKRKGILQRKRNAAVRKLLSQSLAG